MNEVSTVEFDCATSQPPLKLTSETPAEVALIWLARSTPPLRLTMPVLPAASIRSTDRVALPLAVSTRPFCTFNTARLCALAVKFICRPPPVGPVSRFVPPLTLTMPMVALPLLPREITAEPLDEIREPPRMSTTATPL